MSANITKKDQTKVECARNVFLTTNMSTNITKNDQTKVECARNVS